MAYFVDQSKPNYYPGGGTVGAGTGITIPQADPNSALIKSGEWANGGGVGDFPDLPTFMSILDDSGQLLDKYKLDPKILSDAQEGIGRSRGIMDLLKSYATGETGTSPWAKAQMDALRLSSGKAMGDVGAQVNAATRGAASTAASRGGLTSAMRANLARNAQNQAINAKQGVVGQRLLGEAGIMSGDADRQLGILSQLPGMENNATNLWANIAGDYNKTNIANALGGVQAKNAFDLGLYEQKVKQQAGKEMATATANQGKK